MPTTTVDLNLLRALEALLLEGSVTAAAERAGITVPAMSRALGRLREVLGDQLFVRAGRGLVPTPRAQALREQVRRTYAEATTLLAPERPRDLSTISRTVVIRASDAAAALFAAPLSTRARREAPGVRLRFVPEGDEDDEALRAGHVDLDLGVQRLTAPELKRKGLAEDRFVAVVKRGHPLTRGRLTAARLVAHPHLVVARGAAVAGPIDAWLEREGLRREVAVVVGSFLSALLAAAGSALVATMPSSLASNLRHLVPVVPLALPVSLPPVPIAMAWHPRFDDDEAHRWLRAALTDVAQTLDRSARARRRAGR
jgi:DNA-binding transcriptional LysR family regulator